MIVPVPLSSDQIKYTRELNIIMFFLRYSGHAGGRGRGRVDCHRKDHHFPPIEEPHRYVDFRPPPPIGHPAAVNTYYRLAIRTAGPLPRSN